MQTPFSGTPKNTTFCNNNDHLAPPPPLNTMLEDSSSRNPVTTLYQVGGRGGGVIILSMQNVVLRGGTRESVKTETFGLGLSIAWSVVLLWVCSLCSCRLCIGCLLRVGFGAITLQGLGSPLLPWKYTVTTVTNQLSYRFYRCYNAFPR